MSRTTFAHAWTGPAAGAFVAWRHFPWVDPLARYKHTQGVSERRKWESLPDKSSPAENDLDAEIEGDFLPSGKPDIELTASASKSALDE
jgi:hypothetical protein